MDKTRLLLIGGFLGAGKTTLLRRLAERLAAQGRRVGLITNDQAANLVDTALLATLGSPVLEVAGSCFCCNFPGFLQAVETLRTAVGVDVILAEPVGSCTDLSATILQPLKDKCGDILALGPLSVLVDPERAGEIFPQTRQWLHDSAAYIVGKQLEEADTIVINKTDRLAAPQLTALTDRLRRRYPQAPIRHLSALRGDGVADWLAELLAQTDAGRSVVPVDYDRYAAGEAVLGWCNAAIALAAGDGAPAWQPFCAALLSGLQGVFQAERAAVGHVKLLLTSGQGHCLASLTRTDGTPCYDAALPTADRQAQLIVNARVAMPPERLEAAVRAQLREAGARHGVTATVSQLESLRPGRPDPTYRYRAVV